MRVSTCMASYNGQEHINEQVASILDDLGPDDQLIIVDDASTDSTYEILEQIDDPRITLAKNSENLGHVRTFEHALRLANGDVIALSDQDDLWPPGRTAAILEKLQGANLVAGNFDYLSGERPISRLSSEQSGQSLRNIVGLMLGRRPYFGSCMAMTSELRDLLLPFPKATEAHDHWIAIMGNIHGPAKHISDPPLTHRRIHDANLTPTHRRTFHKAIRTRLVHVSHVIQALRRS